MSWHDAQVLYIFAPPRNPYGDNWVEQILGSVVRPVYQEFMEDIDWLWVTRYVNIYDESDPPGHHPIPETHLSHDKWYRHILFRASVSNDVRKRFQSKAIDLVEQAGCYSHPEWVDYDVVRDLGKNRFIRSDADDEMRARRAALITSFIDATVKLMIDSLVQDKEGRWVLESNSDRRQNPHGSFMESVHHLFSNATMVPTTVLLSGKMENLIVGTHHKPFGVVQEPINHETNEGEFIEVPVRY